MATYPTVLQNVNGLDANTTRNASLHCELHGEETSMAETASPTAFALTQISAYSKHNNLAVSWSDAYSVRKKTGLRLNTSQTKHDANDHGTYATMWKESAHRLRTTFQYFAESERCFRNAAFASLCFRWYTFPNCMQISRPLAYGESISPIASATAGSLNDIRVAGCRANCRKRSTPLKEMCTRLDPLARSSNWAKKNSHLGVAGSQ